MMKKAWSIFLIGMFIVVGIGGISTTSVAIDAYFDTEISTQLEPEPYFGMLSVRQF